MPTHVFPSDLFAMAPTDPSWFAYLRRRPDLQTINFWTPTPWKLRGLTAGSRLYFLVKGTRPRRVGGYGIVARYETLPARDAWTRYGEGNGVASYDALVERLTGFASRRSETFAPSTNPTIGCIVLRSPEFFDDSGQFTPEEVGLSFPNQVVTIKYFNSVAATGTRSISAQSSAVVHPSIPASGALLDALSRLSADEMRREVSIREDQPILRRWLIGDSTDVRCAICEDMVPADLAWVAHIKPRSECDPDERRDPANLMIACKLGGCDDLFERGYLIVRDGLIERGPRLVSSTTARARMDALIGRRCDAWTSHSARYFASHAARHEARLRSQREDWPARP